METNFFKLFLCGLLISLCGTLAAQNVTVRGTVTDPTGALPGATIAVKVTTTAVVSGIDGGYSITVPRQQFRGAGIFRRLLRFG